MNKLFTSLGMEGERHKGQDVRAQNVTAAIALANIIKTSLGPVGQDKMLVDDIGDVTITNDGATILKKLEVVHPAARVLVDLAQLQDDEVGDGTTSVVIIAAELLKRANELVKKKIHPTNIISGFRVAMKDATTYIKEKLAIPVEQLGRETLINIAKTSMSSKIISSDAEFFATLCVAAAERIKAVTASGKAKYNIKHINILKAHGRSAKESQYVEGYALNCVPVSQAMPRRVTKAKIALIDFTLHKARMPQGVMINVNDPTKLDLIRQQESELVKKQVQMIINAGATVVLATKDIDDVASKYLVEAGIMGVKRCKKSDLERIAKATGGQVLLTLANLEGEESFDPSMLGEAETVSVERIADEELVVIKGTKLNNAASIILRGANTYMLEEMERSVHDVLCALKRVLESGSVVPGGGAVETAVAMHLENFARTMGSREQLAVAEFGEALLVIPKQLALNAALDATDMTAKLATLHNASQKQNDKAQYARYGLDLFGGKVRDNVEAGILEPAMSKVKCIQFATEAAITILRIDDMIKLAPRKEPSHDDHDH